MKLSAPTVVVAGWGLMNVVFVATLAGFGEQPAVIALYASVAATVEILAVLVWIGVRRRARRRTWRRAADGDSVLILAAGFLIAGLGLAFAWYLALLALPVFALAWAREITARRGEN
jgi:hypothetical protein